MDPRGRAQGQENVTINPTQSYKITNQWLHIEQVDDLRDVSFEDEPEIHVLLQHRDLPRQLLAQRRVVDLFQQVFDAGHAGGPPWEDPILRGAWDAVHSVRYAAIADAGATASIATRIFSSPLTDPLSMYRPGARNSATTGTAIGTVKEVPCRVPGGRPVSIVASAR